MLRPSQRRAVGTFCMVSGPALLSRFDDIRRVSEPLAYAALATSGALVVAGLYLFVYQTLRRERRPRRAPPAQR